MIRSLRAKMLEAEHPVGVKKPSYRNLPSQDYAYGLPSERTKEGVSEITRSWLIHQPSKTPQPPQDFVQINKLAVKMNAINFSNNKDFRSHIDIRKIIKVGSREKHISLPPLDFTYGKPGRPPTPVKAVINNNYGNKKEKEITKIYDNYIMKKRQLSQSVIKTTPHYEKLLQKRRQGQPKEKPLYKHKMFRNANSKVAEDIKQFKSYSHLNNSRSANHIDYMIDQVQNEINGNTAR